jgi:Domain of unknown function (DUF4342)
MDNSNGNGNGTGNEQPRKEEFSVSSDDLMAKFKELVNEGNVRKVSIRTDDGRTIFELPLNIGVAGAAATIILAPALAAIGVIAALVTRVTVSVERVDG